MHRSLLEWEHFKEPYVLVVFLALLLSADKKTGITDLSISELEKLTGLSRHTIIKSINVLKESGEISRGTLKNSSMTTISNFSKYQIRATKTSSARDALGGARDALPISEVVHEMHQSGTPDAPPTHYNILQEENNIVDDARARTRERLRQEIMVDGNIEIACMTNKISVEQYKELAETILAEWKFADLDDGEWNKMHFLSVLRHKVDDLKRKANGDKRKNQPGQLPGGAQAKNPLAGYKGIIKA